MNIIKHYETTLKELNSRYNAINHAVKKEEQKLKKCEDDLRKHYDAYLHALAQYIENYLYKTQQNLFFNYQTRGWFFIEPFGLTINRDKITEHKYMNACLVCIISESGDVVRVEIKKNTTPNQVYSNSTLFNMVSPYHATNNVKAIRHTRLMRQVRHDIRNFIKRNNLQNMMHDLKSSQTIIENEVREIIINNLNY